MEIPSPEDRQDKPEGGVGPTIAIIIIVTLLALGGIYFLVTTEMDRRAAPSSTGAQTNLQ